MHKMKLLVAAAALSTVIASPVLAQDSIQPRATIHQKARVHHHYRSAYNSYNGYDRTNGSRDSGFWPGDVAAGIAGGAVDTAGAIATAPFRTGPYANNSYYHPGDFACQPGTYFRGEDGHRHLCQ